MGTITIRALCLGLVGASISAQGALATDWEDLSKQGYAVFISTAVNGEFKGCEFGKRIPLLNGMTFVCQQYGYSYGYVPDVYILTNVRGGNTYKVIIDDEEYDGTLVQPSPPPKPK